MNLFFSKLLYRRLGCRLSRSHLSSTLSFSECSQPEINHLLTSSSSKSSRSARSGCEPGYVQARCLTWTPFNLPFDLVLAQNSTQGPRGQPISSNRKITNTCSADHQLFHVPGKGATSMASPIHELLAC